MKYLNAVNFTNADKELVRIRCSENRNGNCFNCKEKENCRLVLKASWLTLFTIARAFIADEAFEDQEIHILHTTELLKHKCGGQALSFEIDGGKHPSIPYDCILHRGTTAEEAISAGTKFAEMMDRQTGTEGITAVCLSVKLKDIQNAKGYLYLVAMEQDPKTKDQYFQIGVTAPNGKQDEATTEFMELIDACVGSSLNFFEEFSKSITREAVLAEAEEEQERAAEANIE